MREKGMMKSKGNRKMVNKDMANGNTVSKNRMIGHVAKRIAILGICGCALAGCGDGMQTEEELVIPVE